MSNTSVELVITVARQVLSARGPMSEHELLGVLEEGFEFQPGSDPEQMLLDILDQDTELSTLADGRLAWIPGLLNGKIFTHRLSAVEVAHDIIGVGVDLLPLDKFAEFGTYRRLTDGSPLTVVFPLLDCELLAARGVSLPATAVGTDVVLLLPPGRLAALDVTAGDLIGLRVHPDGFELAAVAEPAPCDIGAPLAALLKQRPDQPEMLAVAVWTVCAGDNHMFREAVAPLTDLLSASGLVYNRDMELIARSGFDFATWQTSVVWG